MHLRGLLTGLLATLIPVTAFAVAIRTTHPQPTPRKEAPLQVVPPPHIGDVPDAHVAIALAVDDYLQTVNYLNIQHYYALVAEQQRIEAQARMRSTVRRYPTGGGGVGDCTGFAIPDYIIQRESGGQPFVWNSEGSGAFGCAQTLITHYNAGGSCAGFDPYTIEGQRGCVYALSNGGTNLAPWQLTR